MKYAFLIYGNDTEWSRSLRPGEGHSASGEMPQWVALFEELGKADPNVSGFELDARRSAKVVKVQNGERS